MRKRGHRRSRPLTAPMLVTRGLNDAALETQERMLVQAFVGGWATTEHYDSLTHMRNVLTLAAAYKEDEETLGICNAMRIPMANLRTCHEKTGRLEVTGEEMKLLQVFVDVYRDFWLRQPAKLYDVACAELNRALDMGLCTVKS